MAARRRLEPPSISASALCASGRPAAGALNPTDRLLSPAATRLLGAPPLPRADRCAAGQALLEPGLPRDGQRHHYRRCECFAPGSCAVTDYPFRVESVHRPAKAIYQAEATMALGMPGGCVESLCMGVKDAPPGEDGRGDQTQDPRDLRAAHSAASRSISEVGVVASSPISADFAAIFRQEGPGIYPRENPPRRPCPRRDAALVATPPIRWYAPHQPAQFERNLA
jgi:hypothetical protein